MRDQQDRIDGIDQEKFKKTKKQILVLGAGSWGTALALQLAHSGHNVYLNSWRDEHNQQMMHDRHNEAYLPQSIFPENLTVVASWKDSVQTCDDILIATPSSGFRASLEALKPYLETSQGIISATKGFCHQTGQLLDCVATEICPNHSFGIITGPSFAKEVSVGLPTAMLAASEDERYAKHIQHIFNSTNFRCYHSTDIVGAEVGGALKNVLAIACGVSDGLGFGANARAGLITRGLNELTQLGVTLGGNRETFYGLSGLGDLLLTCIDNQSRNRRFGLLIGQGQTQQQACNEVKQVVEGIATAKSVYKLAKKSSVSMPISEAVYEILYEKSDVNKVVKQLLTRELKAE